MEPSAYTALGRTLFRWRSYTPVPVVLFALWYLWSGPTRAFLPAPYNFLVGFVLAACGQAVRAYLMGTVRDGTSGQDYVLNASALNTHGPYRFTRNPLYLGNFLIILGVVSFAGDRLVLLVAVAFFFLQYSAIIAAEEHYLRGRFGAVYDEYAQRVPRFFPRLTPAEPPAQGAQATRFDWRRALKKEHNSAFAWLTAGIVAWALPGRIAAAEGRLSLDTAALAPYFLAWLALAAAYVLIKLWKKGKLLSNG